MRLLWVQVQPMLASFLAISGKVFQEAADGHLFFLPPYCWSLSYRWNILECVVKRSKKKINKSKFRRNRVKLGGFKLLCHNTRTILPHVYVPGSETFTSNWCKDILVNIMHNTPHNWSSHTLQCFPPSLAEFFQKSSLPKEDKSHLKRNVDTEYKKWKSKSSFQFFFFTWTFYKKK